MREAAIVSHNSVLLIHFQLVTLLRLDMISLLISTEPLFVMLYAILSAQCKRPYNKQYPAGPLAK